ncbi:MAG: hypothetical protein J0M13_00025 [Candidatus Accumulibacter sp.]|jgi:hypothetical protein|nr:hypothetical protein [Candidatus Accumulibacter necessarius]
MKLPMVLPWLAHRAGVSDSRAEALWQQATCQAELMTGERGSSCYWGAALQILLDLLEQERLTTYPLFAWPWLLMRGSVRHWSWLARHWLAPTAFVPLLRAYRAAPAGGRR